MNKLEKINYLLYLIMYQLNAPDVTTMSYCECGNARRGSGKCISCLEKELGELVGLGLAKNYVEATAQSFSLKKTIQNKAKK